ncbi:flagellar biosynthesis protein FlhB [Musicola paradisiaca]|uniref:Flagellar biosynthetic protein FlhB n=1 Tax=Musicola paradisiaca (strain Ech703) TaxID=579405 RepID=C6C354_MUSP7|nr:flagellar biosynthesis protein FlhB [Musicola paradisiaca]ACS85319.1 flagellar biosynthetic protein FlhB [Musicola paradisiaca Ech703]
MADDSDLEKTEAPTPHRKEKAREEGQIPRSRELTSIMMLVVGLGILWMAGDIVARRLALLLSQGLFFTHEMISDDKQMLKHMLGLLKLGGSALVPIILGTVVVAIAAPVMLGGLIFSTKQMEFNLNKLNPISGIKRLVSSQMLAELFKAILKAVVVGGITSLFLWHNWQDILRLVSEPLFSAVTDSLHFAIFCGFFVLIGLIPMVGFDVFWQIWSHLKKLRMSKQDIRDEFKQNEGDPHVKGRIRQLQRAMAQRRMMADVPKADVIVTNPTHYAVALQYNEQKMSAPKVLAKGAGEIALKIRELGNEHKIPILEAPPLARALYKHSEIGKNIPSTLYAAVAEVLVWVYQIKRWKREGGIVPRKPTNLPVPDSLDFAKENIIDG